MLNHVIVGDAMVRELDFSRMTLRLVEENDSKSGGKDEHIIAKLAGNTIDTLKRCFVSFCNAIRKVYITDSNVVRAYSACLERQRRECAKDQSQFAVHTSEDGARPERKYQ